MKRIKSRTAILSLAFGILIAGSATALASTFLTAAQQTVTGRILGCYGSGGALRVLTPGATCGSDTPISWMGHTLQATVNSDGTYGNAWGIKSVSHTAGSGIYDVFTTASSGKCVQLASLAFSSGQISVEGNANFVPNEVQV